MQKKVLIYHTTRSKTVKIILLLFILVKCNFLFSQNIQLTPEQKRSDFIYINKILKENYPFFGVKKRAYNINWLEKIDNYLALLEKTENDSSYIVTLQDILKELNDGHLNLNPTRYGNEGYKNAYNKLAESYPHFITWSKIFDQNVSSITYWATILKRREQSIPKNNILKEQQVLSSPKSNYSDSLLICDSIAIMTIRSFNLHKIEDDRVKIDNFLKKISNSNTLIIDIQENSGGSERYWIENIVQRLLKDTIQYIQYPIIKDGPINRLFYSSFFSDAKLLSQGDNFTKIPTELIEERYFIKKNIKSIYPQNPVEFNGIIYLLVSKKVFSASEGFAQFCKNTKWAIIAGEQTGGDGIGSDPALVVLPESKIVIGYPSLVGLNNDGSINAEERTKPDIDIYAEDNNFRLKKLIELIKSN